MADNEPSSESDTPPASSSADSLGAVIWWATLAGVVLVAVAGTVARLLALDHYPGGLAIAEAEHALAAREAVDTGLRSALADIGDLSIPLVSGIALIAAVSGFDEVTPRLVAALAGGGSILFTGLWLRRGVGPVWGVAGAAVLAVSFWHLLFSRVAIGPVMGALAVAAALWFLSMAADRGRPALGWYLLFGLAAGAGFVASPGLRLIPLVVLGILGVTIYRAWREPARSGIRGWLAAVLGLALLIVPYLIIQIDEPGRWTPWAITPGLPNEERAGPLALPGAVIDTVTGLVIPSDSTRGLNLPEQPWFSLFMLPWALIGLLGLISDSNDPGSGHRYLVGAAGVAALLVGVAAVDPGHPGGYLVASPLLAGLVVYGFRTALNWARMPTVRMALALLIIAGLGADAWATWDRYRGDWATDPDTGAAFNAGLVDGLTEIQSLPRDEPVFVNAVGREPLITYLAGGDDVHPFDGSRTLPFPAGEDGYLLNPHVSPMSPGLELLLGELPSLTPERDDSRYALYRLDERIRGLMPFAVPTVTWETGPVLLGGQVADIDAGTLSVLIAWNLPAEAGTYQLDVLAAGIETGDERSATVQIDRNPLASRLYQVVVAEVDVPEDVAQFDLSVRLRDAAGQPLAAPGVDSDGFLLLNRYELPS